jgi:hypothetical protein
MFLVEVSYYCSGGSRRSPMIVAFSACSRRTINISRGIYVIPLFGLERSAPLPLHSTAPRGKSSPTDLYDFFFLRRRSTTVVSTQSLIRRVTHGTTDTGHGRQAHNSGMKNPTPAAAVQSPVPTAQCGSGQCPVPTAQWRWAQGAGVARARPLQQAMASLQAAAYRSAVCSLHRAACTCPVAGASSNACLYALTLRTSQAPAAQAAGPMPAQARAGQPHDGGMPAAWAGLLVVIARAF